MNSTAFTYYSHSHTKWHTELSLPRPLNKIFDRKFFGHLVFEFLVVCLLYRVESAKLSSKIHSAVTTAYTYIFSVQSCNQQPQLCLV